MLKDWNQQNVIVAHHMLRRCPQHGSTGIFLSETAPNYTIEMFLCASCISEAVNDYYKRTLPEAE